MKTNLKTSENMLLEIKQHWFVLILPSIATFLGIAFSCVLVIFFKNIPTAFAIVVVLFCLLYFSYKIVERNNNLWIVTTSRVIDEFGVFSNNSKDSPIDKINNISFNQSLIGKLFGYGHVQIQTAAEVGSTTYFFVEHPNLLKDAIGEAIENYKQLHATNQAETLAKAICLENQNLKNNLAADLERLFDLKQKGILTEEEYNVQKQKLLNS